MKIRGVLARGHKKFVVPGRGHPDAGAGPAGKQRRNRLFRRRDRRSRQGLGRGHGNAGRGVGRVEGVMGMCGAVGVTRAHPREGGDPDHHGAKRVDAWE